MQENMYSSQEKSKLVNQAVLDELGRTIQDKSIQGIQKLLNNSSTQEEEFKKKVFILLLSF